VEMVCNIRHWAIDHVPIEKNMDSDDTRKIVETTFYVIARATWRKVVTSRLENQKINWSPLVYVRFVQFKREKEAAYKIYRTIIPHYFERAESGLDIVKVACGDIKGKKRLHRKDLGKSAMSPTVERPRRSDI